jgi:hypothetical protein
MSKPQGWRAEVPAVKALPKGVQKRSVWGSTANANPMDWTAVDMRIVGCALMAVHALDGALLFGAAEGGRGINIKLYRGKDTERVYAKSVDELHELLLLLIDDLASPSEDLRAQFGIAAE